MASFYWKPMNALARTIELRAYRSLGISLAAPVLDLGCGDGGVALTLTALGLIAQPVCGLDICAADLARARRSGGHQHVVRADARRLPFADGCFATVLANGVLCCLPQGLDLALAEVRRVLSTGGLLLASVPTRAFTEVLLPTRALGWFGRPLAERYARRVERRLNHATVHTAEEWMRILEAHGLVVERCEPLFSSAAGRPWSLLLAQPLRIFGILRLPGFRGLGRALSTALFARDFARLYRADRSAGPPFGYVLIAARRPTSMARTPRRSMTCPPLRRSLRSIPLPEAARDRLQVLLVCDHFGHTGGVVHGLTTYYRSVLPGLARHGITAGLCVLGNTHPAAAALAATGIEPFFCKRGKWDPRALLDLARLVRELKADILHLINIKAMSLGCLLARQAGVPTVLHFHDRVPPPPLLLPLVRPLVSQAAAVIAASAGLRDFVATTYRISPARIEVVHNGVDLTAAHPPSVAERAAQRARLGLSEGAPVIAIVGRIAPEKRQRLLIRTMPAVLQVRPDAVLLVVGDGPERPACEADACQLGVATAVRFLGQRDDVAEILAAADVLALTSTYEGLGYVILEAAALAIPAVAFASGGVPEIIRHEASGLLVPPDDIEMFASALISLVREPGRARRLGTAAREEVRRFDLEQHLAMLAALYRRLLAGAPKATHRWSEG